MPPRPASTSGRRGSSQRQESDEERAVQILERLAAAADLGAFALLQPNEERCLHAVAPGLLFSVTVTAGAAGSPSYALLAAWLAAVARGMQLAAQQLRLVRLREHSKQVDLLCDLSRLPIGCCFRSLQHPRDMAAGSGDGKERMRVALSVLAMRAGVVKAHEQLSLHLTSIISGPQAASSGTAAAQQQQQQQAMAPEVARLVSSHLQLFALMAQAWPGGASGLLSPSLCQAMLVAAGLAAAVLRTREVIFSFGGVVRSSWRGAYDIGAVLCHAYKYNAAGSNSVPAQVAGSSSLGTLLMMWLGLTTQRLHQLQRGLSPAAVGAAPSAAAAGATSAQQPRLAVPAYHTQLLQALGVAADGAHPKSPLVAADVESAMGKMLALFVSSELQQLLAEAAVAASCQLPLLLVLLECALLAPKRPVVEEVLSTLQCTLACSGNAVWQLGPAMLRTILEQDAGRRALEAAAAPAGAAPAAAADVSAGAAGELTVPEVLALLLAKINFDVVESALVTAVADEAACLQLPVLADWVPVWLEHAAQYASLLEAGLRMMQPGIGLFWSASAAVAVAFAARATDSAGGVAMAADSQQQVFALLLSCLKGATAVAAEQDSSASSQGAVAGEDAEQIWEPAVMVVLKVIDACRWQCFPGSNSSSSDTSNRSSIAASAADATAGLRAQLGCVLLARCLVAAGRLLQQQAQAPARDCPSTSRLLLEACAGVVTLLVHQLTQQAAAEPWVQQLLDEHAPLEQQLDSLQAQMPAPGATNPQPPAAAMAGVAEQLQAFGAAVCAALPVQECCDHHDCRNLEQASELELVSGKSCVCGGCRVARYCSRECQVAHYKGWHKAVCKRL